jgi:hypothetical protein
VGDFAVMAANNHQTVRIKERGQRTLRYNESSSSNSNNKKKKNKK